MEKARKEPRETSVLKARLELTAPRELLVLKELLAHKAEKVLREPKETSAPLDLQEIKD